MKNTRIKLTKEQLRQLQMTELEILEELDRICRLHHIKYSLYGGTLLGAVRHKGFIPWDDDIDVVMLRSDYEKFYHTCKTELDKDNYFLQEYRTDPYYRWGYEKIRKINTSFVRCGQEHMKSRDGIFIDIFVVDNVPDSWLGRRIHLFFCYCIRKILYSEVGRVSDSKRIMRMWWTVLSFIPRNSIFKFRNKIAKRCNQKETKLTRHMTFYYRKECRYGLSRKYFDQFTELEFEGKTFPAFKKYDAYLTQLYGDYRKLPPKEERISHMPASRIEFSNREHK